MKQNTVVVITAVLWLLSGSGPAFPKEEAPCPPGDPACAAFAKLAETDQHERIIALVDPKKAYSAEARRLIGQAYLMLAGRETNTPEQEEAYCLQALDYGATSAYMGLYFIHAGTDENKALGYLRQYVATGPKDSVPYVILGEAELQNNDAAAALGYLREAQRTARGRSANLDWLLFQASYLTGDHATAVAMLESSFAGGKTREDLQALTTSDDRFGKMDQRPEYKKFSPAGGGKPVR